MSATFHRRPLAAALAAIAFAGCGAALAATAAGPRDAAVPPAPAVPDINARIAQAMEMVAQVGEPGRRGNADSRWLALDEGLMSLPSSWAFVGNEFGNPREIVKNAPYTAEAVTESVQVLPDGNRIVKKATTLLARDGVGRTRQEGKGDARTGTFIYDPIEGRSIVLNESKRTATRLPRLPAPPEPPAPPGAGTPPPPPPAAGARSVDVQPGRVIVRRGGGDGTEARDVHVEVIRIDGSGEAGAVPPPPPLPPLTLPLVPRGKGETKSLGTREFEGIKAEGTLTTHTIPAGAIGNEKPIVVTSERWFSPELHVVVFAKTSDPRAGETTYRLTNVKRGEPAPDLFKVPADYTTRGDPRERKS
ncbi:MAG: hypothetical protein U1F58_12930 [Burkholderiales bacterium]